jgi:hypothetical protein
MLRQCETRILITQNDIHAFALKAVENVRTQEHELLDKLDKYFGDETIDYIKKKEEMEAFLEQLKSTCSLTEVVVKGTDIEMLILKKQLCEKFDEFQNIHLDPLPKNIFKKVLFVPGNVEMGDIKDPIVVYGDSGSKNSSSFVDASDEEKEEHEETEDKFQDNKGIF